MSDEERLLNLLNEREAGRVLGVKPNAMRDWRKRGIGPPYMRLGHRRGVIRYDPLALRKWISQQSAGA